MRPAKWQVVTGPRGRNHRAAPKPVFSLSSQIHGLARENKQFRQLPTEKQQAQCDEVVKAIQARMVELERSGFSKPLIDLVWRCLELRKSELDESPQEESDEKTDLPALDLVCYGVGRLASCQQAQLQFAMALLIRQSIEEQPSVSRLSAGRLWLFDPAMSLLEETAAASLGASIIAHNEEGKRSISQPTLFYMPHCGRALYNNVLWANWNQAALQRVFVLGNSFAAMLQSQGLVDKANTPCLARLLPFTKEQSVRSVEERRVGVAFSSMSLHAFHVPDAFFDPGDEKWAQQRQRPPELRLDDSGPNHDPEIITTDRVRTSAQAQAQAQAQLQATSHSDDGEGES